MSDNFNPYHQWLGLPPSVEAPDLYQLLDLPLFESDEAAITQAADKAMSRVRSHRPGEHARQWAKILDQLKEAKQQLIDPESKERYDRQLQHNEPARVFRNSSVISSALEAPSAEISKPQAKSHTSSQPEDDNLSFTPFSFAPAASHGETADSPAAAVSATPVEAVVVTEASSADSVVPPHLRGSPPPDPMAPMIETPPVEAPLLHPPSVSQTVGQTSKASNADQLSMLAPQPEVAEGDDAAIRFVAQRSAGSRQVPLFLAIGFIAFAALCGVLFVAMRGRLASNLLIAEKPVNSKPQDHGIDGANSPAVLAGAASTKQQHPEKPPKDASPNNSTREGPPVENSTPDPTSSFPKEATNPFLPVNPEPAPASTRPTNNQPTREPTREPTRDELAALSKALTSARRALERHEVESAQRDLALVNKTPLPADYAAVRQRLQALAQRCQQFWNAAEEGLNTVKPGDELEYRTAKAVVKESSPSFLEYEVFGITRRLALRKLPLGLAIALAEKSLSSMAPEEVKVVLGAPLAAQTEEALSTAGKSYWKEAAQEGASTEELLAALDDTYDFAAARGDSTNLSKTSPEQLKALSAALQTARDELAGNNLDAVGKELTKAEALAKQPEHQAKVARLRLLAGYLEQFWGAAYESMLDAAGGDIEVDGKPVSVVETTQEKVILYIRGRRYAHAVREIPGGIAVAFVRRWLSREDVATSVILGSIYAVQQDKENQAKARRLWQDAIQAGADLGDLMLVLDDEYDLRDL